MTQELSSRTRGAQWYFFSGGPGTPRYGDDPTKHAVDHDTETFVREVLQNSNDQNIDGDDPVEVTFRFVTLSGEDRREFLNALQWESGLSARIATISNYDHSRGYQRFCKRLEDPGAELRLLIVEDRNTTGLTGEWDEDSNFAALVRDELYSSKQEDTAGGSYGLGKSVLWTFSSTSTVVFNSQPVDTKDNQQLGPRLIGRTKLPTHEQDGSTYQGAGWLCQTEETEEGIRPESLWGVEAEHLAERLHVDRPATSGTSAMVIGYQDPTRDTRPKLEDLANEFLEAAVKYFWPAITRGDLRVFVETPEEEQEADVHTVSAIRPFVECYEERHIENGSLNSPGDVAGLDVPMKIPSRSDDRETPDGSVRLAARLASPLDEDTYLNHVALFRGAGMVVKYYDQSRVAFGDRNFFGVLACGEARADRTIKSDAEIDRFLRFAEPPEHDEWESTENLRDEYQRGFRKAIDEMFDTLRDGLRHLVARSGHTNNTLSNRVLKRFPIHGNVQRQNRVDSPSRVFEIKSSSSFQGDHWAFTGYVSPEEEFEKWTAEVSLTGIGEDGSKQDEVPISSLTADSEAVTVHVDDSVARIVADGDAHKVKFHGKSYEIGSGAFFSGNVGETQLEIKAEMETPAGD
ncbi:hypothetical protein HAPAU_35690 [Halalkalicoccus paucihalophilus]|uniref:Uncharacterized protein n=1 Tax=Halalkalicoccus paucihalophilus TaxID=1008153 RepID=A0A151AA56_9EURY|nr:hypothetical protein [Halalkalicoccus paucihalophilus]KYH24586.1 hypothetical protein HAPAU_35690 [Halalkalicoccus paucihalophilus]